MLKEPLSESESDTGLELGHLNLQVESYGVQSAVLNVRQVSGSALDIEIPAV